MPEHLHAIVRKLGVRKTLELTPEPKIERVPTSVDPKTARMVNLVVGAAGLLAGLIFILGGGFLIHRYHLDEFVLASSTAEGLVVENRSKEVHPRLSSGDLPYVSYHAIVRFTDRKGQIFTYADAFGFSSASFQVGQRVRIFYDPRNPQRAMIDRGVKNVVVPLVCAVFGGFLILGSAKRLMSAVNR